jgi:hypothetical protein
VRAHDRERDDVAIRSDAALGRVAEFQENARRIFVRIGNVERLVDTEIVDVGETVAGIVDAGPALCGLGLAPRERAGGTGNGGRAAAAQELTPADFDEFLAPHVRILPIDLLHSFFGVLLPVCLRPFHRHQTV